MKRSRTPQWTEQNKNNLLAHLARLRLLLDGASDEHGEPAAKWSMAAPAAIDFMVDTFGLDGFARDLLLICAGVELDGEFSASCAAAQGAEGQAAPTLSLALAFLPGANWEALSPQSPLRRWRLIDVGAGPSLTLAPLRIDERVLLFLTGAETMDAWLESLVRPLGSLGEPAQSHQDVADQLVAGWQSDIKAVQLFGPDAYSKREVAVAASAARGCKAFLIDSAALPTNSGELARLMRLWEREWALGSAILVLDTDEESTGGEADRLQRRQVDHFISGLDCPFIVLGLQRRRMHDLQMLSFAVGKPPLAEQQRLWRQVVGHEAGASKEELAALAFQFNLNAPDIRHAHAQARLAQGAGDADQPFSDTLWDSCRMQARLRLDELVQRIEPRARWEDLVLPEEQLQTLEDILVQVSQRPVVYQKWGFGAADTRGLGLVALFAGSSGTGKTMAAEVLAIRLKLDLYRVDLSAVVSKYIGETEKNLRLVFDAAEAGGAILLFDEADALFGKRTEVKDSHDRHANIEVSYLLQRMEAYHGLAILTSNLKESLDTAFVRRLRFIVQFPFPGQAQREEIWRRVFPDATPLGKLAYERLARLNIAGGNIRNIALHAAFLAASEHGRVEMRHLRAGARNEYAKLERPFNATETGDWA